MSEEVKDDFDEQMARLFRMASDPKVVGCLAAIREIAGYDLPAPWASVFERFHAFMTQPEPKYISAWRSNPKTERWYHLHVNGVLGNVRGGLAAACYHAERLGEIEAALHARIAESGYEDVLGRASLGVGGTQRLDFEYQAFVLACHRCLEYLAQSVACYFKTQPDSFRTLRKSIANPKFDQGVAAALSAARERHEESLQFVLEPGPKSLRHRIAHYDFVSAGVINLTPVGFFLAGGGEGLGGRRDEVLSAAIDKRLSAVRDCVADVLNSFIAAVIAAEEMPS